MDLDPDLFLQKVPDQLICPICHAVMCDPHTITTCDHTFCRVCITEWLNTASRCPADGIRLDWNTSEKSDLLKPASRLIRSFIDELRLHCPNSPNGCQHTCELSQLRSHLKGCQFDPSLFKTCDQGCGQRYKLTDGHNCLIILSGRIEELKTQIETFREIIKELLSQDVHQLRSQPVKKKKSWKAKSQLVKTKPKVQVLDMELIRLIEDSSPVECSSVWDLEACKECGQPLKAGGYQHDCTAAMLQTIDSLKERLKIFIQAAEKLQSDSTLEASGSEMDPPSRRAALLGTLKRRLTYAEAVIMGVPLVERPDPGDRSEAVTSWRYDLHFPPLPDQNESH